ncbi:MAG: hypothetical protein AAF533_17295 [Acidobacteriota bacterium]
MGGTGPEPGVLRSNIRTDLDMLSDPEALREYERKVPYISVPAEIICNWFDDHYHPDCPWFRADFTEDELRLLARFNDFYDERCEDLPTSCVDDLLAVPEWQEIMVKAAEVLRQLPEPPPSPQSPPA